jgi:hypothetical protein
MNNPFSGAKNIALFCFGVLAANAAIICLLILMVHLGNSLAGRL